MLSQNFTMASGEEEVRIFLERNNLSYYLSSFLKEGYDDLNQIISMADNYSELESMMKDVHMFEKPGHRKRFVAAIQILASRSQHGEPVKVVDKGELLNESLVDSSKCKDTIVLNP